MKEYKIVHKLIQMRRNDCSAVMGPSEEEIKGFEGQINGLAKEGWTVKLSNTVVGPNDPRVATNNNEFYEPYFSFYVLLERDSKCWKDAIDGDYHG